MFLARQATAGPRPFIFKFTQRRNYQSREESLQGFCNINWFTGGMFYGKCQNLYHLTPQTQGLLANAKKF